MDPFNLSNSTGVDQRQQPQFKSNSSIMMTSNQIERRHNDDPLLKTTYPVYLYRPPFGYPRNVNVVFLRQLAKNPYVFSVIKAITDQAAETKWEIKPKEGVDMDEPIADLLAEMDEKKGQLLSERLKELDIKDLYDAQKYITQFFQNPNTDNESFAQLLRKIIPDILTLDSGVFYKVYNRMEEFLQLRVIDGGAILKNPDRHGSLADREDYVNADGFFGNQDQKPSGTNSKTYKYALDQYNSFGYKEEAAYFQFAYGINYSIPIPYGRKELIYMIENPATDTVYSRTSALQSAVDITLNLIYSSKASLDLFLNANIPSGIIQLAEATQEDTESFQKAFYDQQYSGIDEYGLQRKVNGRLPVVGSPDVNFIPLNFKSSETQLLEIQQWFTKVLWSCFGVTAEEMGFTENSNKAVSKEQTKVNARKAVKPRLKMIASYLNDNAIDELPFGDLFTFLFDEFDVGEEIQKNELYTAQIANGTISPQMVAEKEGVDLARLKKDKEENAALLAPDQPEGGSSSSSSGGNQKFTVGPRGGKRPVKKGDQPDSKEKEVKSVFNLDGKLVVSGETPEEILKQAIEMAEAAQKEISEEEIDSLDDVMDDSEEKQLNTEEGVAQESEVKADIVDDDKITDKKQKKLVLKSPIERVMEPYIDEIIEEATKLLDKIKKEK